VSERRISEASTVFSLVVSTPLKNISQNGNLPRISPNRGENEKKIETTN